MDSKQRWKINHEKAHFRVKRDWENIESKENLIFMPELRSSNRFLKKYSDQIN